MNPSASPCHHGRPSGGPNFGSVQSARPPSSGQSSSLQVKLVPRPPSQRHSPQDFDTAAKKPCGTCRTKSARASDTPTSPKSSATEPPIAETDNERIVT